MYLDLGAFELGKTYKSDSVIVSEVNEIGVRGKYKCPTRTIKLYLGSSKVTTSRLSGGRWMPSSWVMMVVLKKLCKGVYTYMVIFDCYGL